MKKKFRFLIFIVSLAFSLSLVAVSIWIFYRPQAATSCTTVSIYTNSGYGGTSACLAPGNYNRLDLAAKNIPNDSISSVKVPSGMTIKLYENESFSGESLTLGKDVSSLESFSLHNAFWRYPSWNDETSSVLESFSLHNAFWRYPSWNDETSSVKVVYTTCPAPATETRSQSCPTGQTGTIEQTRTRNATPVCDWGEWKETKNTCVTPPPTIPDVPTVNISANGSDGPITIDPNNSVKLSWDSDDAESCTASGGHGWSGGKNTKGEQTTEKISGNATFVLKCSNDGGEALDSVIVNVKNQNTTTTITAPTPPTPTTKTTTPTIVGMPNKTTATEKTTTPNTTTTTAAGTDPTVEWENTTNETTELAVESGEGLTVTESTGGVNWVIVILVGLVVLFGGIYAYIRYKGAQVTSSDLVDPSQSEGNVIMDQTPEATPSQESSQSSTGSSLSEAFPSSIAEAQAPDNQQKTNDMSID